MASQTKNNRNGRFYSQGELESPYLRDEPFVDETQSNWEARLVAVESQSPLLHAFEQGQVSYIGLEEKFVEAEEPVEPDNFLAEEVDAFNEQVQAELEDNLDKGYDEVEYIEGETDANKAIARMKFEFQTKNRIWRNDGKTSHRLGRKYGPDDFLVNQEKEGVRLESENEDNGFVEFETEWFRTWPKLEKAVEKAVKMTESMSGAGPAKFNKTRKAFPFNVDHLRIGLKKEKEQGFWDQRKGKEVERELLFSVDLKYQADLDKHTLANDLGKEFHDKGFELSQSVSINGSASKWEIWDKAHNRTYFVKKRKSKLEIFDEERILGAQEELEVEIVDNKWFARIQSSEGFMLEYYESFLRQQEEPSRSDGTIKHAKAILDAVNTAHTPAEKLVKLHSFLQIIVNYIINAQHWDVKGQPSKTAFSLMNRTNFASIYERLLTEKEKQLFQKIIKTDAILKEMGMDRKHRVFKNGYGTEGDHLGPTVHEWLSRIPNGVDLLSGPQSGNGLSAAMGRYPVETKSGKNDRWQVKFETRLTKKMDQNAKAWVKYALDQFNLASNRERDVLKLANQRGMTDENKLTNLIFHARHPELEYRQIRDGERNLAQEWIRIRDDLVRPLLQGVQPELETFDDTFDKFEGLPDAELPVNLSIPEDVGEVFMESENAPFGFQEDREEEADLQAYREENYADLEYEDLLLADSERDGTLQRRLEERPANPREISDEEEYTADNEDEDQRSPTIRKLALLRDDFATPVGEDEVIGLDGGNNLNIQVSIDSSEAATRDHVGVKLVIRTPQKLRQVIVSRALKIPKKGMDPVDPSQVRYQLAISSTDVAKILTPIDRTKEIATVRRIGGTSDTRFIRALGSGWQVRGQAEQALTCGTSGGSFADERPDALKLFQAGGVALLELKDLSNVVGIKRFIRDPADIFYYTGHGTGRGFSRRAGVSPAMNCLAIEDHGSASGYCCWIEPADIIPHWKSPMDLDVLIIAGCSVLAIDGSSGMIRGDGLSWAKLLNVNGGPLVALLGYGDWDDNEDNGQGPMGATAPKDSGGGDSVSTAIGAWIRDNPGLNGIIRKWLTVNMSIQNPFAVGFDKNGYCWRTRRKNTPGWTVEDRLVSKDGIRYVIEKQKIS